MSLALGWFQICRIRRSLDTLSTTTLLHALTVSHSDNCNTLLAGWSEYITDKLQRVLNDAASVINVTWKFDSGLYRLLHSELNCPDITQQTAKEF